MLSLLLFHYSGTGCSYFLGGCRECLNLRVWSTWLCFSSLACIISFYSSSLCYFNAYSTIIICQIHVCKDLACWITAVRGREASFESGRSNLYVILEGGEVHRDAPKVYGCSSGALHNNESTSMYDESSKVCS